MKNVHTFKVGNAPVWEPWADGIFVTHQKETCFYYKGADCLYKVNCSDGQQDAVFRCSTLPLPCNWFFREDKGRPTLVLSADRCLDLQTNEVVPISLPCSKKYAEEAFPFHFGKYKILQNGTWGYRCLCEDTPLWSFRGRAYLATDIVLLKDVFAWGTSGAGGFFYLVEQKTGKPRLSLSTGGTKEFVVIDSLCYVAKREKSTSEVLCISSKDGSVLQSCPVEGVFTDSSRIYLQGNSLFVTTFTHRKDQHGQLMLSKIEL